MWLVDSVRSLFARDAPKVSPGSLLDEQARPNTASLLSPHRESVAENLKPARLARILQNAVNGDAESYLILAEEMELRETHYRSVLGTRKLAVCGIPPNVESAGDDADSKAIAEHVEEAIVKRPEFEGLVADLMDGVFKGFSNVEILWDRSGRVWEPRGYKHRDPRHFVWDPDTLETCGLRTISGGPKGEPLLPYKWLQHRPKLVSGVPLRGGIAMPAAVAYMAKRYTVADWLTFLDIFGMPIRYATFPAAMQKRKNELLRALQQLGTEACAVIPEGMELKELKAGGANGAVYRETAEYWDKQTSKVVLGQTMSSDDGASLAQSKTHERVRFDIRAADGRAVAATINRDLVVPFVQLNYGPRDKYPTIAISQREPEDVVALLTATKTFVDMGGRVEESAVRDRIGWQEPADGAQLLKSAAALMAEIAPKPEPGPEGDPPAPKDGEKPVKEAAPKDDPKELNRLVARVVAKIATLRESFEVIADAQDAALGENTWRPLLNENVGRLLELVQEAKSFDEVRDLLRELDEDEGVELNIESFVSALKRATFKVRGVGNATDRRDI